MEKNLRAIDKARIALEVNSLVQRFCTRDPFKICNCLNIPIIYGDYSDDVKGFYAFKGICVNKNIPDYCHGIIIAHELGHAVMHSDDNYYFLIHSTLFPVSDMEEVEANCFAAELLFYNLDGTINKELLDKLTLHQATDLVSYKALALEPETDIAREYLYYRQENERVSQTSEISEGNEN